MAEFRSSVSMQLEKLMQEADSREKILDAKIEDQGDKLRLGMLSLQSAIGEGMIKIKIDLQLRQSCCR